MSVIVESRIIGTLLGYGLASFIGSMTPASGSRLGTPRSTSIESGQAAGSSLTVSGSGSTWRGRVE
jgi:hypothetical protein